MCRRIVFASRGRIEVERFQAAVPRAGEVLVRSICSLVSTGTEQTALHGRFDPDTHWDRYVKYPFHPGYACIATVASVGPSVDRPQLGATVAVRRGHASAHVLPARECYPVPDDMDPRQAAWFALAKIGFMGALAARHRLGDSVLIVGAGPVGQMSLRWALAAGCDPVVVVDPLPGRLVHARAAGASRLVEGNLGDAAAAIAEAFHGGGPDTIVDSTGNATVLARALPVARTGGRVVLLGDPGSPARQHLTSDVITRGISIVGAHDGLNSETWNDRTIARLFFALVAAGRFPLDGLTSHTYRPQDAPVAYEVMGARQADTMGVLFDWSPEGNAVVPGT